MAVPQSYVGHDPNKMISILQGTLDIVQSWVPLNLCNSLTFMVHEDA